MGNLVNDPAKGISIDISDVIDALRAFVSDVKGMQRPLRETEGDPAAHDAERADYFGEFPHWFSEHDETMCEGAGVRVCWPNLRITLEKAENLLRELDVQ